MPPLGSLIVLYLRLKAIERAAAAGESELLFTSPMVIDAPTAALVRARITALIAEIAPLIDRAASTELWCLNADLFRVEVKK